MLLLGVLIGPLLFLHRLILELHRLFDLTVGLRVGLSRRGLFLSGLFHFLEGFSRCGLSVLELLGSVINHRLCLSDLGLESLISRGGCGLFLILFQDRFRLFENRIRGGDSLIGLCLLSAGLIELVGRNAEFVPRLLKRLLGGLGLGLRVGQELANPFLPQLGLLGLFGITLDRKSVV